MTEASALLTRSFPGVSCETLVRLERLASLVRKWNPTLNLVSRHDLPLLESRHIADCLQWAGQVPEAADAAIDIGSGAGFPGLVLAIARHRPFWLVEPDRRKAAFLREAARLLPAPATVIAQRVETLSCKTSLITSRGTAALTTLLSWSHPLLAPGGVCLFMKGRNSDREIEAARREWAMHVEVLASGLENGGGVLLRIGNLAPARS